MPAHSKTKRPANAKGTGEESLSHQAYHRIRTMILSGEATLGATLPRRQLAEQFGMSVLPVSEALLRLEHEGLVESRPRIGTRVRIPTPIDVRGQMLVREALESQAARLFAMRATDYQRQELMEAALKLDSQWSELRETAPDYRERLFQIHDLHSQFHMRIADCSGYPALRSAIEKNQVHILVWLYDLFLGLRATPNQWHRQLMEAISTADPIKADEAMREHVRLGLDDLLQRLEPFLQWDEEQLKKASRLGMRG